jgi:hypothetical protein
MCGFMVRDNSRGEGQIVSCVVSGIGFLGAGVILHDLERLRQRPWIEYGGNDLVLGCNWSYFGAREPSLRPDSDRRCFHHQYCSSAARLSPFSGPAVRAGAGGYVRVRADLPSRGRSSHARPVAAGDVEKFHRATDKFQINFGQKELIAL